MAHHQNATDNLAPHLETSTLEGKNKFLGFWLFLGGETVLFACLFGVYLGLTRDLSYSEFTPDTLFSLPLTFVATMVLLFSSLTSVLGILNMRNRNIGKMQFWFVVTILLGWLFNGIEVYEFVEYVHEGFGYTTNAFSSAFYTLLGFHGAHVFFGTMWCLALLIQSTKKGITAVTAPKFYVFSLYWHFVDVVWVFIFTLVYLMGKVG